MRIIDADKLTSRIRDWQKIIKENYGINDKYYKCLEDVIDIYIDDAPAVNAIDRQQFIDWLKTAKFHDISDGKGLCLVMFKEEFEDLIKAFK